VINRVDLQVGDWRVVGPDGVRIILTPDRSPLTLDSHVGSGGNGLDVDVTVKNLTRERRPFEVRVVVHFDAIAEHVQVLAPAEEFIVDGREVPVSGNVDLRRPRTLETPLSVRLTRRHFANLRSVAAILGADGGREVWFANSADFSTLRVDLDVNGAGELVAETGQRFLAPGETWRGSAQLTARVRERVDWKA
jgi:hypothetical protein